MHKISSFTGSARHGWDKMTPSMGFGPRPPQPPEPPMPGMVLPPSKQARPDVAALGRQAAPRQGPLNLSFNVPFSSNLAGPEPDDVIHATPGAFTRWTHPEGTPEGAPSHKLPVHAQNVEALRLMCKQMTEQSEGRLQATVTSSEPRPIPGLQPGPKTLVTNVCLAGEPELVRRMRGRIFNDTPISLVCWEARVMMKLDQD
jgi:hypothetical protein